MHSLKSPNRPNRPNRMTPRHWAAPFAALLLALMWGGAWAGQPAPSQPAPSPAAAPSRVVVAAVPFGGTAAGLPEEFGLALAESLRHGLSQVRMVQMLPSARIAAAAEPIGGSLAAGLGDEALLALARGLKVRLLVGGSYRLDGDSLTLQVRLADPAAGTVAVGEEVVLSLAEFWAGQEQLARQVLQRLKAAPTAHDERRLKAAFVPQTASVEAYTLYARAMWQQGLGTKEAQERAVALFETALKADDNFALAHFGLAVSLVATNNRWKAQREIRKAIQLDETNADVHRWLGDLLVNSPRRLYDQAIQSYQKAAELSPDIPEVYVGLGDARQAKGQYDEAVAEYQKALALQPDNARVYYGMGKILYTEKQQYHEAVEAYQRAIQLEPTFMDAHLSLGEVYEEKGLYKEAIERYGYVLSLEPRHPGATYGLALAYEKVDPKKAMAQWEAYIELASTLPSEKEWVDIARRHLNKLKRENPK
jgi:tetratricopeptide (TPR) repeat protein